VRVLVTGPGGLIGRHAVRALRASGHEVHAVGRTPPLDATIPFTAADLLDERQAAAAVEAAGADVLLHLAWITAHGRFWRAPENLDWLAASLRLARRFVDAGGRRIVTAGTCAEYDWSRLPADGVCREEATPLGSAFLYGVAKDALRACVGSFCRQAGASSAHGRVFFVYGEGEAPARLAPSVIRALLSGQVARTSIGEQVRDFMSARDLGAAFAALAVSSVEGPVNMASGDPVRIADLVEAIRVQIGGEVDRGAIPANPAEPPRLVADAARLRREVGFEAFTPLEQGLAELIEATRRELAAG
jgi:nucleoside-diphosphate-sugar epimerase